MKLKKTCPICKKVFYTERQDRINCSRKCSLISQRVYRGEYQKERRERLKNELIRI
jgi:endogenous inhibitor of DNA gyrase (YacG/DUF329 family)